MQLLLANEPIRLYTSELFRLTLTVIKVSFRIASNIHTVGLVSGFGIDLAGRWKCRQLRRTPGGPSVWKCMLLTDPAGDDTSTVDELDMNPASVQPVEAADAGCWLGRSCQHPPIS